VSESHNDATVRTRLGRAGFETGSDIYERARPGYPSEAVELLIGTAGLSADSLILDLAAGTGRLTRQLHQRGLRCLAAEPSPAMRQVFARVLPEVPMVAATGEQVPLAAETVDAVLVAQAFHWFDAPVALAEIDRILQPGGWLGLIWNERDESDPMVADLVRISKWDQCAPYPVGTDFGAVQRTKLPFVQQLDLEAFVEQVASRSYVQVLPEPDRRALLGQVEAFGATLPQPIAMPYVTDLFCAPVVR